MGAAELLLLWFYWTAETVVELDLSPPFKAAWVTPGRKAKWEGQ